MPSLWFCPKQPGTVELSAQLTTRFIKALEVLIERGLLEDVPSERAMPVWRQAEEDNEPRALIITEPGLVAIGVIAGCAPGAGKAVNDDTDAAEPKSCPEFIRALQSRGVPKLVF